MFVPTYETQWIEAEVTLQEWLSVYNLDIDDPMYYWAGNGKFIQVRGNKLVDPWGDLYDPSELIVYHEDWHEPWPWITVGV